MAGKKMGRPTDNPKPYRGNVRLDEESKKRLTVCGGAFCSNYGLANCKLGRFGSDA